MELIEKIRRNRNFTKIKVGEIPHKTKNEFGGGNASEFSCREFLYNEEFQNISTQFPSCTKSWSNDHNVPYSMENPFVKTTKGTSLKEVPVFCSKSEHDNESFFMVVFCRDETAKNALERAIGPKEEEIAERLEKCSFCGREAARWTIEGEGKDKTICMDCFVSADKTHKIKKLK